MDCFNSLRNPYIPLDVPNPTMAQDSQRHLTGEGREKRKTMKEKQSACWDKILGFKKETPTEEDEAANDDMMDALADDIIKERKRIGGDWAVAGCLVRTKDRNRVR